MSYAVDRKKLLIKNFDIFLHFAILIALGPSQNGLRFLEIRYQICQFRTDNTNCEYNVRNSRIGTTCVDLHYIYA